MKPNNSNNRVRTLVVGAALGVSALAISAVEKDTKSHDDSDVTIPATIPTEITSVETVPATSVYVPNTTELFYDTIPGTTEPKTELNPDGTTSSIFGFQENPTGTTDGMSSPSKSGVGAVQAQESNTNNT